MKPVSPIWKDLEPPVVVHRMTASELQLALDALGISQTWLAAWLGTDRHQMSRWCRENSGHKPPWWMTFVIYLLQTGLSNLPPNVKLEDMLPLPDRMPSFSSRETPKRARRKPNGAEAGVASGA